jgi:predicted GNAT superfamily acetyltransferase
MSLVPDEARVLNFVTPSTLKIIFLNPQKDTFLLSKVFLLKNAGAHEIKALSFSNSSENMAR